MKTLDDIETFNEALYHLEDPKTREWMHVKHAAEVI